MADTALQVVVSPLLGVFFEKLSSPLLKEFAVKKDLEKLSGTTSAIKSVLEDAEHKQIHDATTRDWLRKLKEAAYQADDVIEECEAEALFPQNFEVDCGNCSTQVCHSFSTCFDFKRLKLRNKISNRIKEIGEKFNDIAEERKFHLNERAIEEPVEDFGHYRETSSVVLEDFVYGRDRDRVKENIVGILLNGKSNVDNLLVYSVIGMGGLGKTTLVQCVYKDKSVEKNFHAKIWVCVSDVFSAKKIIKAIIESVSGEECKLENLDAMESRLKDLLTGKKFLLVLDDVWNEDPSNWAKIKFPLRCGAKGSSIIVTTRSVNVAQIMGVLPMNQHKLAPLSDEECWSLFKGMAFEVEVIDNSELERIGRIIVKKCGGVPLAAKALGGSLRSEREVNVWKSISTSEIWELRKDGFDGGIFASLSLSYNRLPGGMKQCFSHCSIFPKDHIISVTELIQFWMANGLVQSKGTLELEDVGRRTFNTLLQKSFFQEVERDDDGKLICKMHDLMHDLACDAAKDECIHFNGKAEIPDSIRHLSTFGYSSNSNILQCLHKSHSFLRTLIGARNIYYKQGNIVFKSLRCLRVLDLSATGIKVIPASIGKMKHLRYLDLSDNGELVCLPSSLCDLKTLQTLKLRRCYDLKQLPKKMNSLVNLIHLDLHACISLTQMPPGIGELVRLRTLELFRVGGGNGQSIKELGNLDKLGGDLVIRGLEDVKDATEARVANLAANSNLINLSLWWDWTPVQQGNEEEEEVFEALQPHPDLSGRLHIFGYRGSRFPSWMQNLEKLSEIRLWDCSKCEDLPPLGHLPLLQKLYIGGMASLKRINKEFYGTSQNSIFPSLEDLYISGLHNLEEWEALDVDDTHLLFPKLQRLEVSDCPKLALLPCSLLSSLQYLFVRGSLTSLSQSLQHLSSLESLSIYDCDKLEFSSGDFQHLLALQTLYLYSLPKMISLPDLPHLPTLQTLEIRCCDSLTSLSQSLQHLSSLQSLSIYECNQLEFSSGDFQHLLALQTLQLSELPKLISLPDLPTLQSLGIYGCPNLKVTPHSFQNLTSLHTLQIEMCEPDLESKCKKDTGEYWQYISHIPNLYITSEE